MKCFSLLLILTLALGSTAWVSTANATTNACWTLFQESGAADLREHSSLNPTAALSPDDYKQINNRRLKSYARLLFKSVDDFLGSVRTGDTVLDIGGGRGRAMWDLANLLKVNAIIVNTQNYKGNLPYPKFGTLDFRAGWAEDVLPTLKESSVNEAFDVYGAFTYSPKKDFLIEEIFRVLKPGGRARLLFDYQITPAFVETPQGDVRLDRWLVANYPELFSVHATVDYERDLSVIVINKPIAKPSLWRSTLNRLQKKRFSLGLEIVAADANPTANVTVPRVLFRVKQN
jgi:SAM-dependent methyltransferase